MKQTQWLAIIAGTFAAFSFLSAHAQVNDVPEKIRRAELEKIAYHERMVMVPMRDGVRLATDIYRPKSKMDGPVPVILWKTPYNFNKIRGGMLMFAHESVKRGYALVIQNERGKFYSEGEWEILGRPRTDGYDTLGWISDQPWANGKVGTLGCSSSAEWQMGLAAMDHPAHAAMIPMGHGAGIGRMGPHYEQGTLYRGGAMQLLMPAWLSRHQNIQRPILPPDLSDEDRVRLAEAFDLAPAKREIDWKKGFKHLPIADLVSHVNGFNGVFSELVKRLPDDPAWYEGGLIHDDDPIGVPALWMGSWYDHSIGPVVALYNHARENGVDKKTRENQYLLIAPFQHCKFYSIETPMIVGERNMGDISYGFTELVFDWFDKWMKGTRNNFAGKYPKVQYFAMGANEWRAAQQWPPKASSPLTLYLSSEDGANSVFGDGRLSRTAPKNNGADYFSYDPMNPVQTIGGGLCCMGEAAKPGAFDQRMVEARQDVLVYTSEPLDESLEATGSISSKLFVSSDAPDTDFTLKLVDVLPDGTAFNLDDTILRVRFREGFDTEVFMEKGEIYKLELPPLTTSNVFGVGHRIRIEISSSNFPRYDRNLNTGGKTYFETEAVVTKNVVHHSARYPSSVTLTIVE